MGLTRNFVWRLLCVIAYGLGLMANPVWAASAPTPRFEVNSTADLGDAQPGDGVCDAGVQAAPHPCTLRAALQEALAGNGGQIVMALAPAGGSAVPTIALRQALPAIHKPLRLEGGAQPGAYVVISGAALAAGSHGLVFESGAQNSVISALRLREFSGNGIVSSVAIRLSNVHSTDHSGRGVSVEGADLAIDGTDNVFSRNAESGVVAVGSIDANSAVLQAEDNGGYGLWAYGSLVINGGGAQDPHAVAYLGQISSISRNGKGGLYNTPSGPGDHVLGGSYLQVDHNGGGSLGEGDGHGIANRGATWLRLSYSAVRSNRGDGVRQLAGDVIISGTGNEFSRNGRAGVVATGHVDGSEGEVLALWNQAGGIQVQGNITLASVTACNNEPDNLRAVGTITLQRITPCAEPVLRRDDMECLLHAASMWYENELPSSGAVTHSVQDIIFRHYPGAQAYVGIRASDQAVIYVGPLSHFTLVVLGNADELVQTLGCKLRCSYDRLDTTYRYIMPRPTTYSYAVSPRTEFSVQALYRKVCGVTLPSPQGRVSNSEEVVYLANGQAIAHNRGFHWNEWPAFSGGTYGVVIQGLWDVEKMPVGYMKLCDLQLRDPANWDAWSDPIDGYGMVNHFGGGAADVLHITQSQTESVHFRFGQAGYRDQCARTVSPGVPPYWKETWDSNGQFASTSSTCTPITTIPLMRPPDAEKHLWPDWQ